MAKKSTVLLFLLVFSSLSGVFAGTAAIPSVSIEANTSIAFDYANSSLAESMLSDNVTTYDVLFFGSGWGLITISTWENTGSVTFDDDAYVTLTNTQLDGLAILTHDSNVSFVDSALGEVRAEERTSAYFEGSTIDYLHQGIYYVGTGVTLQNSVVVNLEHQVRLGYGKNTVDGLRLYGDDLAGMNISRDAGSIIQTGFVRIYATSGSIGDVEIIGISGFSYDIDIYSGANNVEILNTSITEQSYLDYIENLTLNNTILDYSSHGIGMRFSRTNGTIVKMEVVRGQLDFINCDMDFVESHLANVSYSVTGDSWNSDFQPTFNDTTIKGDFELDALVPFEHHNFAVLGKLFQKVVVDGPVSFWQEVDGGVNYQNIIKSLITNENLFDIHYHFKVLQGVDFTINTSEIYHIDSVNATVTIHDSIVFNPQFGYNTTITVYNSIVQPYISVFGDDSTMNFGDHSHVNFYHTTFSGLGYNWKAKFTEISMDHVNFSSRLDLHQTNFTASSSYFRDLTLHSTDPCTITFSVVDSLLDSFHADFVDTVVYDMYFENTTVRWWSGGDPGSAAAELHLELVDVFVKAVWNWNWDEVADLVVSNSIVGLAATGIKLLYYQEYTRLSWSFDGTIGAGLTGEYEIQRSEYSNQLWTDWEPLGQIAKTSYEDSSVAKGGVYAYRVLAHYELGYMLYALSFNPEHSYIDAIIPARTAYQVRSITDPSGEDVYLDPDYVPIGVHVELEVVLGSDASATTYPSESLVVQYEFLKSGGEMLEQNNLTNYYNLDLRIFEAGDYLLRARASSDQVRFWGEWLDIEFTVLEITPDETTPTGDSEPEPALPGFGLITVLLGLFVVGYMVRPGQNKKV